MNKKITVTTLAAVALAFLFPFGTLAGSRIQASANSAPPYWEGTTATGVIVTGEQCPIEVEHELLTLNIPHLPQFSYASREEFETYAASVTAEYTFYNPTDMDVNMDLVFPFGTRPDYTYAGYDAEANASSYYDDTARFLITADGEEIDRELRYTYQPYSFSAESMYSISDEKRVNDIFSPEAPVTKYSYTVDFPKGKDNGGAEFVLQFNPTRTKILCWNFRTVNSGDGNLHLYHYADKTHNATFGFTAVGEVPEIISTSVKENGYGLYDEDVKNMEGATVRELLKEETTFGEYVESSRPEGIGEVDFYNGFMDRLSGYLDSSYYGPIGVFSAEPFQLSARDFMRWYKYSLFIPAGGRLVNTVTAPLYPTINRRMCEYEYLLSPAQKWAGFGTLDIVINTEFEILESSLDLEKAEGGYTLSREGLPLSELTFSIEGDYEYPNSGGGWIVLIVVVSIVILLGMIAVAGGIVSAIVLGVKRARKKRENQ